MLSRKLIILTSIVATISLTAGCALFKPKKESSAPSSADPIVSSDSEPSTEPEPVRPPMTNDEVCEKLCGFYVNKSYFDQIEKTKSAVDSQKFGESVFVFMDEETLKYSVMHGDMHQGNRACALTDVSYDETQNTYTLSFEPYVEGYETVLKYNDTTKTYVYKGFGTNEPVDEEFLRFDDYYKHKEYIAYLILKDSPDVTVEGQRIYADVDGTKKYIEISSDAIFDSPEADQVGEHGAMGFVSFREDGVEEFDFNYYAIENNTMTIEDGKSNVLLTLKLSPEAE